MAKTRHNNIFDTIDEMLTNAKNEGVLHLYTEDDFFTGRTITVQGKNLFHFGTTGYLGLEQDDRLKNAAVESILKFGTQFPLSKSYISHTKYKELEDLLEAMFDNPVIVAKNSTLAHLSVIPTIVRDEDAVILDHQVHFSVQNACQLLKPRGIPVEMIRHNNLSQLEDKIKQLSSKHKQVYYMADGVYSMYGDVAPLQELVALANKYAGFYIYIDDVHGMSWAGKKGTGFVKSELPELHSKIILISTLSKTFGANGGSIVIPDDEIFRKVKTFGGPLSFSAQLDPGSVGAAIASAKIHLSPEIYQMQTELLSKIDYCNALIQKTSLPLVECNNCPVFFIGAGLPTTGYNLVNRMMKEGYFVNLAMFPAVPIKNTGVRFTVSRHNRLEDIEGLIQAFEYHHPKALSDNQKTINDVRKIFKMPLVKLDEEIETKDDQQLRCEYFSSIDQIGEIKWNGLFKDGAGFYDYHALMLIENSFKGNNPENNWNFHYYIIYDQQIPVLATFFTEALWKDDMLSPAQVSLKIEQNRKDDPYYLSSKVLSMGSLITEGNHLYLDRNNPKWSQAMILLLEEITSLQEKTDASMIVLRDFAAYDLAAKNLLIAQGFMQLNMPDSCVVDNLMFDDLQHYVSMLSSKSRKHLKKDVLSHIHEYEIQIVKEVSEDEMDIIFQLYQNVAERNFDINTYQYPPSLVKQFCANQNANFLLLRLKSTQEIVAFSANYINCNNEFIAVFCGMNYDYLEAYKPYKQLLYQLVLHANLLRCGSLQLGFSASIEKRKVGANIYPKVAFLQTKDNYKLEFLENLQTVSN